MAEHLEFRFAGQKLTTILVLLGVVIVGVGVHIYFCFHLDGFYNDPGMACDCPWVIKNGQLYVDNGGGARTQP